MVFSMQIINSGSTLIQNCYTAISGVLMDRVVHPIKNNPLKCLFSFALLALGCALIKYSCSKAVPTQPKGPYINPSQEYMSFLFHAPQPLYVEVSSWPLQTRYYTDVISSMDKPGQQIVLVPISTKKIVVIELQGATYKIGISQYSGDGTLGSLGISPEKMNVGDDTLLDALCKELILLSPNSQNEMFEKYCKQIIKIAALAASRLTLVDDQIVCIPASNPMSQCATNAQGYLKIRGIHFQEKVLKE
jgi:hypothetical protein